MTDSQQFFMVHNEHNVILGVSEVPCVNFTHYYIEATAAQVDRYNKLQSVLPDDVYVELSEIIRPALTQIQPAKYISEADRQAAINFTSNAVRNKQS